jgi:hypothetical protein
MSRPKPPLTGWTDYPMWHLYPEEKGGAGPWRRCRIVAFNGSKHADVEVEGIGLVEFKIGYVLCQPDRNSPQVKDLHPFRVNNLPWLSGKAVPL